MSQDLTCPRGHQWQPERLPETESQAGAITCPMCGEPPVTPPEPRPPWCLAAKIWLAWWLFWGAFTCLTLVFLFTFEEAIGGMILVGCLIVGVITVIIWGVWLAERRRMLAMAETCKLMDFRFTEVAKKPKLAAFGQAPLLQLGHSQKAHNLMEGRIGASEVTLLDYRYTIGAGKSSQTHNQTVVLLPGGATNLPSFQLFPESLFHKISKLFGYEHIKFPQNEKFSSQYQLRGAEEQAIRRAFNPHVLGWFAAHPGWSVQAHAGWLVVFQSGKRIKPEECPERLAEALRIQGLFEGMASESS